MGDLGQPKAERITIDNRWAIVGPPVSGGMASVVEAFDLEGEFGKVALKLLPEASDDRWRRAGFEREQQALARLVHPNIVRLLATGRDQGTNQRYLVFPWYPTRLQDHLKTVGALSWSAWWDGFGRPILTALELIHRQEVIHRDLKPANIMLEDDRTPVIIDFGIAKLERALAPELTVGGESLPFTPPEAQTPPGHMPTRDVHAWAALTVFAVSGDEPYPEDDRPEANVLAAAVEHAYPSCCSRPVAGPTPEPSPCSSTPIGPPTRPARASGSRLASRSSASTIAVVRRSSRCSTRPASLASRQSTRFRPEIAQQSQKVQADVGA
jgi:serine/threonine protein kinase